jgi:hypothetical protein
MSPATLGKYNKKTFYRPSGKLDNRKDRCKQPKPVRVRLMMEKQSFRWMCSLESAPERWQENHNK